MKKTFLFLSTLLLFLLNFNYVSAASEEIQMEHKVSSETECKASENLLLINAVKAK